MKSTFLVINLLFVKRKMNCLIGREPVIMKMNVIKKWKNQWTTHLVVKRKLNVKRDMNGLEWSLEENL